MHGSGIKECSHRVCAEGPKTAADEGEDGNAEPVDAAGGEGENENSDEGGKAAAHYSDTQGSLEAKHNSLFWNSACHLSIPPKYQVMTVHAKIRTILKRRNLAKESGGRHTAMATSSIGPVP